MEDFAGLYPAARSLAVVPVGLTKYREGLFALNPFSAQQAADTIDKIEAFGERCLEKHGTRFVFASDEWYVLARRDFPPFEAYEDFLQIENGVGMVAQLRREFMLALPYVPAHEARHVTLVTGKAAAPILRELIGPMDKIRADVVAIENNFFGHHITVAGLVTGGDIIRQLADHPLGEQVLIPSVMLRSEQDRFLDDITLEELSAALAVPVCVVENDGEALAQALCGKELI
jgi:NifB/MoaA-like Fe-S oxidoreductase